MGSHHAQLPVSEDEERAPSQRVTREDEVNQSQHESAQVETWNAIVCQTPANRTAECTRTSVSHSLALRELHS